MKKQYRVLIVGGGFGGVKTALELANEPGFEVVLMSEGTNFEYHGALYRTATGHSPMEVVIPIKDILKNAKNVSFVLDTAASVDPKHRTLTTEIGNIYGYDVLVLSLGSVANYFGIDGMEVNSFAMNTMSHTVMLRNKMTEMFKKEGQDPTIAIIGGGPSGVELAGEVQNFARKVSRKYGRHVKHPKVVLIEGADRVLPMFDPVLSAKAYKRLQELGVDIRLNTKVNSCEEGKVCLAGGDVESDIIVWTAGSRACDFYGEQPKVFKMERGRVRVDNFMRAAGQDFIYVIGDNAATQFSGMAQTALHDAKYVARNLRRLRAGKKAVEYRPLHPTYVVPVGPKWAVLQNQKHQWSGRRAWIARRQADLWIFRNFEPYGQAVKTWRRGNRLARF